MNRERRKRIDALIEKLNGMADEADAIGEEEQEAYDNLPEAIQAGDKGQKSEEAASEIGEVATEVRDLAERLTTVVQA